MENLDFRVFPKIHFNIRALINAVKEESDKKTFNKAHTTSKKNKGWSKLGFLLRLLITVDVIFWSPISKSMLGDETLVSWYFFIFLNPQHITCKIEKCETDQ